MLFDRYHRVLTYFGSIVAPFGQVIMVFVSFHKGFVIFGIRLDPSAPGPGGVTKFEILVNSRGC